MSTNHEAERNEREEPLRLSLLMSARHIFRGALFRGRARTRYFSGEARTSVAPMAHILRDPLSVFSQIIELENMARWSLPRIKRCVLRQTRLITTLHHDTPLLLQALTLLLIFPIPVFYPEPVSSKDCERDGYGDYPVQPEVICY